MTTDQLEPLDAGTLEEEIVRVVAFAYKHRRTLQNFRAGRYLVALASAYVRQIGLPRRTAA